MQRVCWLAICLLAPLALAGQPVDPNIVNGLSAIRYANRLVADCLLPLSYHLDTDHFGLGLYPRLDHRPVMPDDVRATLRSSVLFDPLDLSVTIKTVEVDPESAVINIVGTARWQDKDVGYYRTQGERDQIRQASETRDRWFRAQSYYTDYYYGGTYTPNNWRYSYNHEYLRALESMERESARLNAAINKKAKQRKDYAETVQLRLSYNGPLTSRQLLDMRRIRVIVQLSDVDLRPGLRDIDVSPAVGSLTGQIEQVIQAKVKNDGSVSVQRQ